ncbi:BamA/TamA family outer membrane protein [Taibaiella helva]|uniref:hypothetical protein n=1 Tax=Taibaiella helva TaxID=2301235 RepID=UPI000E5917BB|nr:hypothetical protein [Taibaiella helva]
MNYRLKYIVSLLLFLGAGLTTFAQTNLEVFGQNRVQFRRFDWKFYDAAHFKIYHYDRAGRELARYVAEQAEQDVSAIERRLGGLFPERLNIIVYNSYDEYQQSNVGLNGELQLQNDNPAGTVNLVGDKLVIYFTGRHADLKRQLRQGMAQVVMERLMFGENFREMVRNAVLLNLPSWVTAGYVDYVVDGWTTNDDNDWKNILMTGEKIHFDEIGDRNPRLAGKAFWKYIAVKHGENNVKNLLYLTQLKSSLNKALKLTINQKLKITYDSLVSYYKGRYGFEEQIFEPVDTSHMLTRIPVPDDEGRVRDIAVSPRGGDVAYVKWRFGEYQVVLEKTKMVDGVAKRESSVILSGGVKNYRENDDPDYPLVAWNNTGFKLGIISKIKNRLRIRVYNSIKGKIEDFRVPVSRFDRITGFTFMEDDDMLILSAIRKGQSDLFEYRLKGGRMNQLTDDTWDDLAPVFVSGGSRKGIVFLSNRPEPYLNLKPLPNELPAGPMNAFFYNSTTKSYDLLQLSRSVKGEVMQAIPYGSDHFAFLSDQNGVRNRFVVMFARNAKNQDSAYAVPTTNFSRSILYQQYNPASGKIADVIQQQKQYEVFFHKIELPAPDGTATPRKLLPLVFVDGIVNNKTATVTSTPVNFMDKSELEKKEDDFSVPTGDQLQSEFSRRSKIDPEDSARVEPGAESNTLAEMLALNKPADSTAIPGITHTDTSTDTAQPRITSASGATDGALNKRIVYVDSTFIDLRSQPYRRSFTLDFFSIRADNSIIFNRYQSYDNTLGQFSNTPISGMLTASLIDKLEDYRFTGSLRIPVNFSGLTYFMQFENFRRRVDWGLIFYRQETKNNYNFSVDPTQPIVFTEPGKNITTLVQGSVSYPLDKVKSFRLHMGGREDKMVIKAKDPVGLALPNTKQYWVMSRAEFVYDDTRNPTLNIWNGLRYKLFAEYMYRLYSNNTYTTDVDTSASTKKGGFYNLGFDFRYYHKIYKNFIFAIRAAGAHSGGNQKIVYYMGGVDNDVNPKFNNALQPSGKNDYAFQALANNLRGYTQNSRNGNTYALLNAELRFPVFGTLMRRPIQSSILKHLQVVGFVDVGSAWEGLLPTSTNMDRYYHVSWPPAPTSPIVSVSVPNYTDNGIAIGYGAGVRTMLFGYFARFDAAWNIRNDFQWYISLGTDF